MQVHKLKQHNKVESGTGTPLLETTNQQQTSLAATPVTDAVAKQRPVFASDTIDLSIDSPAMSPEPAAAARPTAGAAADDAALHTQQQQQEQQAPNKHEAGANAATADAMETDEDGSTPAAAVVEAGAAASGLPAAAGAEPATPAVAKAAGADTATPGSALHTSTTKVPAEAFLTPEQRQQLLDACLQVRGLQLPGCTALLQHCLQLLAAVAQCVVCTSMRMC
jgi:hypothetical protein